MRQLGTTGSFSILPFKNMVSSYNIFQYLWIWFPLKRIVFLSNGIFENEKRVVWDFIFYFLRDKEKSPKVTSVEM